MKIELPKEYEDIEISFNDVFTAKSNSKEIKIELPKPNSRWWIEGYTTYDTYAEVTLVDTEK